MDHNSAPTPPRGRNIPSQWLLRKSGASWGALGQAGVFDGHLMVRQYYDWFVPAYASPFWGKSPGHDLGTRAEAWVSLRPGPKLAFE